MLHGCEVHVDVHGELVMYVVGGCNVVAILSMVDMVCRNCGVHELGFMLVGLAAMVRPVWPWPYRFLRKKLVSLRF